MGRQVTNRNSRGFGEEYMIEVEIYTTDHVIRGFTETSGERLSDTLNDKKFSGLFLSDVQMARLLTIGKEPPKRIFEANIEKSNILFAKPIQFDITHKSLYRRATRQIFHVTVLLPNFELRGLIHLTEKLDVSRVLTTRPEDFIPLTGATATYMLNPQIVVKSSTLIFNKAPMVMLGEVLSANETFESNTEPRPVNNKTGG